MDFDSVTGLIFGIGFGVDSQGNDARTLVTLDSATATFTQVAAIPYNYLDLLSAVSAIDMFAKSSVIIPVHEHCVHQGQPPLVRLHEQPDLIFIISQDEP